MEKKMTFKPAAKKEVEFKQLTVSLHPDYLDRLTKAGTPLNLTPEEVLVQFAVWAMDQGILASGRRKKAKKKE